MRISKLQQMLALVLVVLTAACGCIILPEVKTKIVDLVASGTACATLDASGFQNNHDDFGSFDIKDGIDIRDLADQAGIDLDLVDTVYVSGVTWMTVEPDPDPAREIVNGNITVERGNLAGGIFTGVGPLPVNIVTGFSAVVNTVTTPTTAPVQPAGIQLIEQLLNECLQEAKGGPPVTNSAIQYHVTGISNPQGVDTNFKYNICVSLNFTAPTEVDVIE